jgi:hypothetical protein
MKWLDKAREIRDSLPDINKDRITLIDARHVDAQVAKECLKRNIYGIPYEVKAYLNLRDRLSSNSLEDRECAIAFDTKGALITGIEVLLAIIDTNTVAVLTVLENEWWDDDPRFCYGRSAYWVQNK